MIKKQHLAHSLKTRHILMIALGSTIGTGLFFGAGESIKLAGPSILLAYAIGGIIMYIVVRALGEMTVVEPNAGSFSYYAYKYLGKFAGFISGWNYWFNYIIVCMLELTASSMFLDYWITSIPHWLTILVLLVIFTVINLLNVKAFGEFEFWFAGIKIVTIIALICFGIYLIFFDPKIHQSSVANIANLWQHNGFFGGGIRGFLLSFVVVIFSFGGTELVGITAAEAENPKKIIPLAINGIIFRIIIFYIATIAIIICLYPWNKISPNISPFVDVFQKIGIKQAATLMNLVALTAALSSFNSGLYGTARMLYNLGMQRNAPAGFAQLSKRQIPSRAILLSAMVIFITVLLNYFYPQHVFSILLAVATIAAMINWITILITQIVFRKKQQQLGNKLFYRLPLFPITSIIAIVFFIIVAAAMTKIDSMRLAIYIAPLWLLILALSYWTINQFKHNKFKRNG